MNIDLKLQSKQLGVSLIGSIFIMVVLSALGVYVMSLNAMQHTSTSLTLQSNRALYAAESGMEWIVWYVRANDTCPSIGTNFLVQNFTVNIDGCNETTVIEGIDTYKVFDTQITATTANSSFTNTDYSSRTLHSRVIGSF